jgi:uncharacterized membrane protein YidH (DUF202 family)
VRAEAGGVPLDRGLQLERTALAWIRTTLSMVLSAVVCARLLAGSFGCAVVPLAVVECVWALSMAALSRRRMDRLHGRFLAEGAPRPAEDREGAGLLLLAAVSICAAALATVLVVK